MELREKLELIEVTYNNDNKKAILTFLDVDNGEVLEVNFNKQVYDNGDFRDDEEKEKQVDKWCEEYFETTFDRLKDCVGMEKDVYKYDDFNTLWVCDIVNKFTLENVGEFFETKIEKIEDDGKGLHVYFKWDDKIYESKMMYADYIEERKEWFVNPQKKHKQYKKFSTVFGVDVENKDDIVGKTITVEVKSAFKTHAYAEIKKPKWNK